MGLISRVSSRTYREEKMLRQAVQKRCLSFSLARPKHHAGVIRHNRYGKNFEMTYEESFRPNAIGRFKNHQSIHAGNLFGEPEGWKQTMSDQQIRYFLTGTFFRLIYADNIIIRRRLNDIDISLFCYETEPVKNAGNPADYRWRGTIKPHPAARKHFQGTTTVKQVKTLSWLKGYSEVMLEKFTHCNVRINFHLVQDREFVYKSMAGLKNNANAPRFGRGGDEV